LPPAFSRPDETPRRRHKILTGWLIERSGRPGFQPPFLIGFPANSTFLQIAFTAIRKLYLPFNHCFPGVLRTVRAGAVVACDRETNARRNPPAAILKSRAHMEEREALKQPVDELAEVDKMIERIQESLCDEDVTPSVAELLRLMQFRREREQPGPVTVRWIDECQPTPASGE
jgi:hypothetical protein